MNHVMPALVPNEGREAAFFELALEKPPAERAALLDTVCAGDSALRRRLEALLAAQEEVGGPMATEPGMARPTLRVEPAELGDEAIGLVIGRYKLLEQVGEGGCGLVYVAEQTEPVRRRVALKVIKLGMDTKAVVARFEAERQALAMMDHPNIAKVLDAGTTDAGRPYFVMELVRGIRITDFCDQEKASTRERLELFIKVCQAIQHAHQKGIIHRDIKPSNILVTLHDGVPVPKVIDFGIAKATEGRLTDATVYTQLHQFIGTPAYMSPEQAEMSGLDIDTRSDIYSLGVLLYELLTGKTPFDPAELISQGIDAMRKTIREKKPVWPSTKLATLGGEELTTTAKRRSVDTSRLLHQLRGDLDWIVMKCLEKDRTRRYESASGLVADLKRHLNNEPVTARPPGKFYEFQKTVRRHKFGFAAAAIVMVVLAVGVAVSAGQALRARKAETAAREELEQTRAALQFIRDDLLGMASPYRQPDPNLTVRKQLDHANAVLRQRTALPPKVEAALRQIMGSVYFDLGEYAIASDLLERALELERQQLGADHEETLRTMHTLAETYWWSGDDERMLKLAQHGLRLSRKARGETNLMTLHFLADEAAARVYGETGTTEETERLITNALRLASATLGDTHELAFQLRVILAHHHNWRGQYDQVESVLAPALAQERSVLPETHPLMLFARGTLARAYAADTNKLPQAKALFRQLLEDRQLVLGTNHPMTVNVEIILAVINLRSGDFSPPDAIHRRVLQHVAEGHLVETRLIMRGLCNLVGVYRFNSHWAKGDELANAVLTAARKQSMEESLNVVTMRDEWSRNLMAQGRYAEAEAQLEKVVEIRSRHPPHGKLFNAMGRLGYCLFKQNKQLDRAEDLLNRGYLELEQRIPQMPEHLRLEIVGSALLRLIEFYETWGETARAETLRHKLTELEQKEGRRLTTMDYIVPL